MKPIAAHELAAADARLRAAYLPWFERLSKEEREALADYKGRAGRAINSFLRGEGERPGVAAAAAALREAMHRAKAPEDMILYRGVSSAEADIYRAVAIGDTTQARAFVSTSLASHVAAETARVQKGTVVELVVRKGRLGVAYINPFPTYRYRQYEVLVNVGSVLRVLPVDQAAIRLEVGDDNSSQ